MDLTQNCCKVANCRKCNLIDPNRCNQCIDNYFLVKRELLGVEQDQCVMGPYCSGVLRLAKNGFFTVRKLAQDSTEDNECQPCKNNCFACTSKDFCNVCRKTGTGEHPFHENSLGQCCWINNCRDCGDKDGIEFNEKNPEDVKKIWCKGCVEEHCFRPLQNNLSLKRKFTHHCDSLSAHIDKNLYQPNHFAAIEDTVLSTTVLVGPGVPTWCKCHYTGQIYQVGRWISKIDSPDLIINREEPACTGDQYEILLTEPTIDKSMVKGGPLTAAYC
jgi:hypothetical protein